MQSRFGAGLLVNCPRIPQEYWSAILSSNSNKSTQVRFCLALEHSGSRSSIDLVDRAWISKWDLILRNDAPQPRIADSIGLLASMLRSIAGTEISEPRIQAVLKQKAQLGSEGTEDVEALDQQARVLSDIWGHLDASSVPWLFEVGNLRFWNV